MSVTVEASRGASSPATSRKRRGGRAISPLARSRRRMFLPFVGPALVLYVALMIVPTAVTVWISLNRWPGAGPMEYVGIDNYRRLLRDPVFHSSFVNTLWILFGAGIVVFILAFIMMMLLKEMPGRKLVRVLIFFPNLIPPIVIALLWGFLWSQDGLVNGLLSTLGVGEPPRWLSPESRFWMILLGLIWPVLGTYTIILMAAADRIPKEMYEVADLSGANAFERFRYITLPMTWDVVTLTATLWVITAIKVFEFILMFSGGAMLPSPAIWNLGLFAYAEAYAPEGISRYGTAAASSVVMLVLVVVSVGLIRSIARRDPLQY